MYIFYIILLLIRYFLVFFYILPRLYTYLGAISLALFAAETICFFIASCKQPGYIKKQAHLSLQELYEKYLPDFICPICENKKHKDARHCSHCRKCIRGYDHHCPWVNNCVGKRNITYFRLFLLVAFLDFSYNLSLGVIDYSSGLVDPNSPIPDLVHKRKDIGLVVSIICGLSALVVLPVAFGQCKSYLKKRRQAATREKRDPGHYPSVAISETSDTYSMMLQEGSEWIPLGLDTSSKMESLYIPLTSLAAEETACCCWTKVKKDIPTTLTN